MSGRPRRLTPQPEGTKADRKSILRRLHDASQLGDVDSVKDIFDAHGREVHVDITRKGKNTTLHTAVQHNQEGFLIDYLIQAGANVNAENSKGYTPLTLAIIHCKGSKALEKLIAAGARWKEKYHSGAFEGLSALDVAIQYKNEPAINFLTCISAKNVCGTDADGGTARTGTSPRSICPICNLEVKYPTKLSRILDDQASIEERIRYNGEYAGGKHKKRKYLTRKYMDQLLSNKEA